MKIKQTTFIIVGVLLVAGAFAYAAHQYEQKPKAEPATVSVDKYNKALEAIDLQSRVNQHNQAQLQTQVNEITAKNKTLCTAYKNAKVAVDPALCL